MKNYLISLLVPLISLFLFACTQESKVRNAASEEAEKQMNETLQAEADKGIQGHDILKKNYVHILAERTEISVDNVEIEGDDAKAKVRIKKIPPRVRLALMEIINRLSSAQEGNFNVGNAIQLIDQQLQIAPDDRTDEGVELKLHKDGDWKPQN